MLASGRLPPFPGGPSGPAGFLQRISTLISSLFPFFLDFSWRYMSFPDVDKAIFNSNGDRVLATSKSGSAVVAINWASLCLVGEMTLPVHACAIIILVVAIWRIKRHF
jgi:hypothetical protein